MANTVRFEWKEITFVIRIGQLGIAEYRDANHFGGPWSEVAETLNRPSIDKTFRQALADAEHQLYLS